MLTAVILSLDVVAGLWAVWPGVRLSSELSSTMHVLICALNAIALARLTGSLWISGIVVAWAAASIEGAQSFLAGRTASVEDLAFDALGLAFGLIVASRLAAANFLRSAPSSIRRADAPPNPATLLAHTTDGIARADEPALNASGRLEVTT